MKIVYIDTNTLGHHISYISALANSLNNEVVAILPEKVEALSCKQYKYETPDRKNDKRSFSQFRKWIDEIYAFVEKENPDIVHILNGDFFYRYFGYGIKKFKKYKTVVTMHCLRDGFLNILSAKAIASSAHAVVLHSEYLKNRLLEYGRSNGVHIEYPDFRESNCDKVKAREFFDLKPDIPVLACIGETRHDKGLDILLDSLNGVTEPFQLLVAGRPVHFDEAYITERTKKYDENVHLLLKFLSEDELVFAMNAADIIVLPYRAVFNAASGPLGEGVALEKCIVGPNHGNLGDTIKNNHLGYTFESEDKASLTDTLNNALKNNFKIDESYKKYKNSLDVESFLKSYNDLYNNL
ncbi:MAG: glycosyltransferase family 4 protein [Clostridia bacterium]|nr:glycosyltransferase family 4 protein [Clostridia bacterium]